MKKIPGEVDSFVGAKPFASPPGLGLLFFIAGLAMIKIERQQHYFNF